MLPRSLRSSLRFALVLGASSFLLTGCFGQRFRELKSDKQMLEARVMQLRQDLEAAREEAEMKGGSNPQLEQRLAEQQRLIEDLRRDLATTRARLQAAERELQDLKANKPQPLSYSTDPAYKALKEDNELLEKRAKDLDVQLTRAQNELKDTQKQLFALKDQEAARRQMSTASDDRINTLTSELQEAKAASLEKDRTIAQLEVDLSAAHAKLDEATRQLAKTAAQPVTVTRISHQAQAAQADPATTTATVSGFQGTLKGALAEEIYNDRARVIGDSGQLRLVLFNDLLFKVGTVELSDAGVKALNHTAAALKESGSLVTVQGHTDDTPIKNMPFKDNKALSEARAAKVADFLIKTAGLPADKVVVEGLADSTPLMKGTDANSRRQNRRVEIIVPQS